MWTGIFCPQQRRLRAKVSHDIEFNRLPMLLASSQCAAGLVIHRSKPLPKYTPAGTVGEYTANVQNS